MLQHINLNAAAHIVRIEDPLEIPIPPERSLITERQVGSDVASADLAVHDALRQRPDVIAVSEVRDTATAGALYEAIDSGHLVLASLHAPTPVDGLARFVSYFKPLLNFEWVDSVVFELAAGVKGGRSPAKRTLDAGCQPVRWLSWPMRHADASAMTSRSVSYA